VIDLHAHILPGLDDGPADMEESVALCRMAAADGIHTVAATPHMFDGLHDVSRGDVLGAVDGLRARLADDGIALEVLPGADTHVTRELPDLLRSGEALTLADGGRYILLELPPDVVPQGLDALLFSIRLLGVTAIITHPERNTAIQSDARALRGIVAAGHLVQVTAASITGFFGAEARRCAVDLLQSGLCHFVASDAHSCAHRPPVLSAARAEVRGLLGEEEAHALFEGRQRAVLAGERIETPAAAPSRAGGRKTGWLRRIWS